MSWMASLPGPAWRSGPEPRSSYMVFPLDLSNTHRNAIWKYMKYGALGIDWHIYWNDFINMDILTNIMGCFMDTYIYILLIILENIYIYMYINPQYVIGYIHPMPWLIMVDGWRSPKLPRKHHFWPARFQRYHAFQPFSTNKGFTGLEEGQDVGQSLQKVPHFWSTAIKNPRV